MTIVRLNNTELAQLLLTHLVAHGDVTVAALTPTELLLSLLGSYREETMKTELITRVRLWEQTQRAAGADVHVEVRNSPSQRW